MPSAERVTVATTAAAPGDGVMFTIPRFAPDQLFGPAKWKQAGARPPQQGDQALAIQDGDGQWWLLSWADQPAPAGGGVLAPVVAALDSPLPACTYDNGADGVGATLTADDNGALPAIDGVSLQVGDRVLIAGQ